MVGAQSMMLSFGTHVSGSQFGVTDCARISDFAERLTRSWRLQGSHFEPPRDTPGRHIRWRRSCRRSKALVLTQHSEQRDGVLPPPPLKDDGHVVDLHSMQDLLDSGALRVSPRRQDYKERRTDGYTEPLELYLLGTSHVSEASADHVRRVVSAVRPQSVVVELCKSRAGLMASVSSEQQTSSPLGISGEGFPSALARSVRIGGQSVALLRALLAWVVQVDVLGEGGAQENDQGAPLVMYGDFRAARESAEEAGAQIVLGDRPLEITLQKAWEALSATERFDLVRSLVQLAFRHRRREEVELGGERQLRREVSSGVMDEDRVEALIGLLSLRFPSVVGPLIYERDLYMAWALKRSRAVCGQRRVVGVVGRGHLTGVMKALEKDNGGDTLVFSKVARSGGARGAESGSSGTSDGGRVRGIARFVLRIAAETAAGYALWELYKTIAT